MLFAFRAFCWTAALAVIGLGAWFGRVVPFAEQWPMFEALRTTAAIIFAVVGAWLAIIYPERLKLSFHQTNGTKQNQGNGSGELFTPVVNSTFILCIILVVGAAVPLLRRHGLPGDVQIWRGVSYGLLVSLTLWQLWTVLLTLIPADRIKSFMDREQRAQAGVQALRSAAARKTTP